MNEGRISRLEAKAQRLTRYLGQICQKHPELDGERLTSNYTCIGCMREWNRGWKLKNKGYIRDLAFRYYAKHLQRCLEISRMWKIKNPSRTRVHKATYRARQQISSPVLTEFERVRIRMRYTSAYYLTKATGIDHHVDHIQPLARNGLHHPDNLQILTAEANRRKGTRILEVHNG